MKTRQRKCCYVNLSLPRAMARIWADLVERTPHACRSQHLRQMIVDEAHRLGVEIPSEVIALAKGLRYVPQLARNGLDENPAQLSYSGKGES